MAHAKHLETAYEEVALQYSEAAALIQQRHREGSLPTKEELQREIDAKTTLEEARGRYLVSVGDT